MLDIKVMEMVGYVDYKAWVSQELSRFTITFHDPNLKKCYAEVTISPFLFGWTSSDDKLHFVEEPLEIVGPVKIFLNGCSEVRIPFSQSSMELQDEVLSFHMGT
ncbi:hypothetical protein Tco_1507798 [Tanacetum coccineum]